MSRLRCTSPLANVASPASPDKSGIRTPRRRLRGAQAARDFHNRKESFVTAHLLVVYPVPNNADEFDRAYHEQHLPYAGPRLKGATSVVTKRVVGPAYAPPPYHMISDVTFPSIDALKACAMSDSGKEALAHAASISSGGKPTVMVVVDDK
jgi:uncharacterized protein (TIGR02118 family)